MHYLMMQVGDAMWLPLADLDKSILSEVLRTVRL